MNLEEIDAHRNPFLLGTNLTLTVLKSTLLDLVDPTPYRLMFYEGRLPRFAAELSIPEMRELARQAIQALGLSHCEKQQKQSEEPVKEMRIGNIGIEFHLDYVMFRNLDPKPGLYDQPMELAVKRSEFLAFELGPGTLEVQTGLVWRGIGLSGDFCGCQEELRILAKQLAEKLWG